MKPDEELRQVQQEIKELVAQQLKLIETRQIQPFYQRWFQQADPKLDSITTTIARLEKDKTRLYDIMQAAASVPQPEPEKDWSKSPFYSKKLKSWNFVSPPDQLGFYVTSLTGIGFISKALWRSWNITKAAEALEKGVQGDSLSFHRHCSGLNNDQLLDASKFRKLVKFRGFAIATAIVGGFFAFVQLKNRNRFIIDEL